MKHLAGLAPGYASTHEQEIALYVQNLDIESLKTAGMTFRSHSMSTYMTHTIS